MRILIVYDSYFGNTEQIALAISKALSETEYVELCRIGEIKPQQMEGLDLLVVGSPTRAFKPTRAISDFLNNIPANDLRDIRTAAFDTRISTADVHSRILNIMVNMFGYAAESIGRKLQKKGGALKVLPAGFFVKDSEGPLKEGELERAAKWAKTLVD